MSKFDKVLKWFGSVAEVSRALGVSSPAVVQMRHAGIPPARAIQIEILTGGSLKAVDLVERVGVDVEAMTI